MDRQKELKSIKRQNEAWLERPKKEGKKKKNHPWRDSDWVVKSREIKLWTSITLPENEIIEESKGPRKKKK